MRKKMNAMEKWMQDLNMDFISQKKKHKWKK